MIRHPLRAVAAALVVLLVVGAGGLAWLARRELAPVQNNHSQQVVVTVVRGESLGSLVTNLARDRLVRSGLFFSVYAQVKGLSSGLHPGHFLLDRGMGPSELVAALEGPPITYAQTLKVTIPDGLWAQQEAARLQKYRLFPAASYLAQVQTGTFPGISPLPGTPAGSSWQGLTFGDTYEVSHGITAAQFVRLQLEDFDKKVRPAILAGAAAVGLTPYQVVVLASVVGAEAATSKDRGLVAGVFFNRLKLGMPLQSDVTILYAMAVAGQSSARFSTTFPSAYNTYLHSGLPPGPINSPGLGAVEAVLHPTATNYLYFVALPSGKVLFSVTAAQHQQQVQTAGLG
ncbi:MAG: endolytic transglycosylase MltG [Candidatus Dormibacteria bacterium]